MGQACWRQGVVVKSKFASPGRPLSASVRNTPLRKKNDGLNNAIHEEEDEESPLAINPEKEYKEAFNIMSEKQIQSGLKKLRENKIKLQMKSKITPIRKTKVGSKFISLDLTKPLKIQLEGTTTLKHKFFRMWVTYVF